MIYTNTLNLPETLVRAIIATQEEYDGPPPADGTRRISVTSLLDPPRKVTLTNQNADELTVDVSDLIWAVQGQMVDSLITAGAGPRTVSQKRLEFTWFSPSGRPWIISGKVDEYENGVLRDWKYVSTYNLKTDSLQKWALQLNLYAWLWHKARATERIRTLENVVLFRDWRPGDAARKKDYPQRQVLTIEQPWMTAATVEHFVDEALAKLEEAENVLPLCTSEETWQGRRCERYCIARPFCEQAKGN